jgi:hypothetical protein
MAVDRSSDYYAGNDGTATASTIAPDQAQGPPRMTSPTAWLMPSSGTVKTRYLRKIAPKLYLNVRGESKYQETERRLARVLIDSCMKPKRRRGLLMRKVLSAMALLLLPLQAHATRVSITGTITDAQGAGLKPNASTPNQYVSSVGSDYNDGLTPGSAKLTLGSAAKACLGTTCAIKISRDGITINASVTFPVGKAVTIECDPRASLVWTSNSNQIIFNGQGSGVFGCGMQGTGAGNPGSPPVVSTSNFFIFDHNSMSSFGTTGGNGELDVTNGQNIIITSNIFNQNGDLDVFISNAVNSQIMFSVNIQNNIIGDVSISNSGTSASFAAVNISNNNMAAGEASKTFPCIKLLSTGTNISDAIVTGNNCVLSQTGPPIAYSFTNVSNLAFTGNLYDASGFGGTVDGLFLSGIMFANISGNTIWSSALGTSVLLTGTDGGVHFGTNNIGSAVTGISIGASATGTLVSPQEFLNVKRQFRDNGVNTSFSFAQGVPCTNGELALSVGWQLTGVATPSAVAGKGQTCSWTITTGASTGANPTITDTLTTPLPSAAFVCEMNIHGGTHTAAAGEGFQQTSVSATAPIFTFNGTPTAGGTTYFVTRRCG